MYISPKHAMRLCLNIDYANLNMPGLWQRPYNTRCRRLYGNRFFRQNANTHLFFLADSKRQSWDCTLKQSPDPEQWRITHSNGHQFLHPPENTCFNCLFYQVLECQSIEVVKKRWHKPTLLEKLAVVSNQI